MQDDRPAALGAAQSEQAVLAIDLRVIAGRLRSSLARPSEPAEDDRLEERLALASVGQSVVGQQYIVELWVLAEVDTQAGLQAS
ncbi:MAG: hypothetical protein DMF72_06330 [Acidobacteria bacterium]|nr:MAG: hypothetical protein DMF72_06330 [Acidobacteriota bacterium]